MSLPKRDLLVQWRIFAGIATFMTVIGAVYWVVSYEEAGTTMLALAAGLAGLIGGWLYLQDRRRPAEPTDDERAAGEVAPDEAAYLPAASVWPLGVAVAAALTLNGLIVGWPFAVPGALLLVLAMAGFVSEGRRRA